VLCLYLPRFLTERLARSHEGLSRRAFCVYHKDAGRDLIIEASVMAESSGVAPGMSLGDARARHHGLEAYSHEERAGQGELRQLANGLHSFCHPVGPYGTRGLIGQLPARAAEERLLKNARRQLERLGYSSRAVVSPNPACSFALAAYSSAPERRLNRQDSAKLTGELPLEALALPRGSLTELASLGLRTIEALRSLPRPALASRFPEALLRLAALEGAEDPNWRPEAPAEELTERFEFRQPCARTEALEHALELVCRRLLARLRTGRGPHALKRIRLTLGSEALDFEPKRALTTAPQLLALFRPKLEALRLTAPLEEIELRALEASAPRDKATQLFPDPSRAGSLTSLVSRLERRLGPGAVGRFKALEELLPERCSELTSFTDAGTGGAGEPHRPLQLHSAPRPIELRCEGGQPCELRERGERLAIFNCSGPERLTLSQERGGVRRDYYRVSVERRGWIWVFLDLKRLAWYEHGLFD
jgi:protein ImuB